MAVADFFDQVLNQGQHDRLEQVAAGYLPRLPALHGLPTLAPGKAALAERLSRAGTLRHHLYRLVADGDLVFAHVRYDTQVPISGADIFRFDDGGQIAEHWNARQPIAQDASRGIDRFAGGGAPDLPTTAERRDEMRRIARGLLDIWRTGDASQVNRFYDDSYIQHNPDMPGGAARIRQVFETNIAAYIAATNAPFPIDCHEIGVQGDLIFIHYSVFMVGINRSEGARSTNIDIFRVGEDGRMVEHWDVLQIEGEVLPEASCLY